MRYRAVVRVTERRTTSIQVVTVARNSEGAARATVVQITHGTILKIEAETTETRGY